jgi:hypothetical protein
MNGTHDENRVLESSVPGDSARHGDILHVMVGHVIYKSEGFSAFNTHTTMSFHSVF